MNEEKIKILGKGNEIITLRELFEGKQKTRRKQAKLPFEEKIKALIDLQKIAYSWGKKKDVIIWQVNPVRNEREVTPPFL